MKKKSTVIPLPCRCGGMPSIQTAKTFWGTQFYMCVCSQCKYQPIVLGYPSDTDDAIRQWNCDVGWEKIYPRKSDNIVLTDNDVSVIEGLRKAIHESDSLEGYCPHARAEVIGKFKKTLDHDKYRLATVFEHYGLGECSLYRKRKF